MNDMNMLPGRVIFGREQTASGSSNNVVLIPKTKKTQHSRPQNPNYAQIHVLPLPQAPRLLQAMADSASIKIRVLLVEENAKERHACRKALQQSGDFAVDLAEVESGEEGLHLASRQPFDCILLDDQLPDMSGMEFLGRLTDLMGGQRQPILKLVAPGKSQQAAEALKRGAHDYLIKDGDGHYLKLLPTLIQRMLESRRLSHEKHQLEVMYRTLVEHIPAITYLASLRNGNHLLYVSRQIEQLGYPVELWLSKPDLRFQRIFEEDRPAVERAFADSCNSGEMFRCEYRMLSGSGKQRWFLDEARVIRGHNGQPMFFQGVMLDVTDMKTMEHELETHRRFLEQRVKGYAEQLEKRVAILESCNTELCNQLDKERMACLELRKITENPALLQLTAREAGSDS